MFSALSVPWSNAIIVSDALAFHDAEKSDADMPAIFANASRSSLPVATVLSMVATVFENAVPPASASTPSEDIAADQPRMSAWLMPTCDEAAATRCAIELMSDSVVAMWLPRLTMAEP